MGWVETTIFLDFEVVIDKASPNDAAQHESNHTCANDHVDTASLLHMSGDVIWADHFVLAPALDVTTGTAPVLLLTTGPGLQRRNNSLQ